MLLITALISGCSTDRLDEALRDELFARELKDQAVRDTLVQFMQQGEEPDSALQLRMLAVDSANTNWLEQVIAERGWPGHSVVGEDAAHSAYLIAQHSPDPEFQKEVLRLLEAAYEVGVATGGEVAYLTDRVAIQEDRPQLYGTQFTILDGGGMELYPIEDSANVDARRAAVGLPSLNDYLRQADLFLAPQQTWRVLALIAVPVIGLLIVLTGVIGLLVPSALIRFVQRVWSTSTGFLVSIVGRAVLGTVFLVAASNSRFPWAIGAVGVISLASAMAIPAIGRFRMLRFVNSWTRWPPWSVRLSLLVAIGFGAFLIYASALAAAIGAERLFAQT